LNYAFDRYSVLGSIMSKDSLHATQLVLPMIAGHNYDLDKEVRPYDPEKAKQLIAEAKADGVPVDNEIILINRPDVFPGSTEVTEAAYEMFREVGLNVKMLSIEEGQSDDYHNKPFKEDREPILILASHDNTKGDPVFSLYFKYGCDGRQSALCVPEVDKMIADAAATPVGPERVAKWQKTLKVLYEDIVPEVWLYATVGEARVSKRIHFVPNISTSSRFPLANITFN
jgi:peptide/nickel transport system substrate-binding protein